MQPLTLGIYTARLATTKADLSLSLSLRLLCFRRARGQIGVTSDADRFDALCRHLIVTDRAGVVVCCCRFLIFPSGSTASHSYSAQFYDLSPLQDRSDPLLELGRFCLHPDHTDPDILRIAWAALTGLIDQAGISFLFGCTSLQGADPALHRNTLAYLAKNHLGPAPLRPAVRLGESVRLADYVADPGPTAQTPPLLRSYLTMGGWVSDHAVIDRDLNTLHVFTGLDVQSVPPSRARALRALALRANSSS